MSRRGPRRLPRPAGLAAECGFTLLELLVALFIAALMFAMGYAAISQALSSHEQLKARQARLVELQTAMRVMEQDFVQLAPRPVRQPIGDEPAQPALAAASAESQEATQALVALTRNGWSNPVGLQRPALQRVAYYFQNGTLRRESWYVLDPTLSSTTAKRDLLTHVKSITFQFMDVNHVWQPLWPPTTVQGTLAQELSLRIRPIAVQVTIDTDDWGQIMRIFEVAG
ncbi:MAG: type II secretion system minor pseudopilin GspJ [Steroidobacteraceae bacterium]